MRSYGSLVRVGLLVLVVGAGAACKKDEPVKAEPAPAQTAAAPAEPPTGRRHPGRGPNARMDPLANKTHRAEYCYYGTFSLRQARDAYLASLGKDEPSAKKIPSFGVPAGDKSAVRPGAAPAPSGQPAVAPPKPPAPKPAASGAASAGAAPGAAPAADHRFDPMRLPHERNARSCTSALGLKEPTMGDVDVQMATFAPFAVEVAKDITAALGYYQNEEYTKDGFARGKELDKKLREEFGKLDDLSDKLGAALAAWHKDHPDDASKMEEGEKLSRATIDAARDVFLMVATRKADGDAWKAAQERLDKATEALKAFADGHPGDTWSKIVSTAVEPFVKTVKGAKITADKTVDSDTYLTLVGNFTGILEGRLRSTSRSSMVRPMMPLAVPSNAPVEKPAVPPQP